MILYILKRRAEIGYDETVGLVVSARDPSDARELAMEDDGESFWLHSKSASCRELLPGKARRVHLTDFNAG